MAESQSRFGKTSWTGEVLNGESGEAEQAVDFQFTVTWSTLFAPFGNSKSADAVVPVNHRVPTLVAACKEPPQREERALVKPGTEELPSTPRQKGDAAFNVAWEMVVPKMVRSVSKTPQAEQAARPSALAEPSEKAETTPPAFVSDEEKKHPLPIKRIAIGVAITLIGILLLLLIHHFSARPKQSLPAPAPNSTLKLEAEPESNGLLNIRWNAASAPVAQAKEGRLVIVERDQQPKVLALTPEQLKSGHLTFQPLGDRVVFRLEVVDRSGALIKDSIVAQSSSIPAAPASPAPATVETKPSPLAKTPHNVDAETDEDSARAPKTVAVQANRAPTREFTPPPSNQVNPNEKRPSLPDPPPVASGSNVPPLRIPDAGDRARIAPPPVKQASSTPTPLQVGGSLQAAKLIKKVTPAYPPMAAVARVQGTVRFTAIVGKDGKIQNLQLVSGPTLLVKAATDAVKQWVYQPTVLNGMPVEVETQINVNFTLTQ